MPNATVFSLCEQQDFRLRLVKTGDLSIIDIERGYGIRIDSRGQRFGIEPSGRQSKHQDDARNTD
jgi:hypothetical protein